MRLAIGLGIAMLAAAPAMAQDQGKQDERGYCPARPGLGEPSCTISKGRVSVEIGVASLEHDQSGGATTDTWTLADTLIRVGVNDDTEVSIGWAPFLSERTRDPSGTALARGGSDVTLAIKHNLRNPGGDGFSAAIKPFVTLPVAGAPGGAGDWGAGLVVPMSWDIGGGLSLQSTTEGDAAVDADGHGRHPALSEIVGLGVPLTGNLGMTAEVQLLRDWDPAGHTTQAYAGLSFALSLSDDLQLDAGGVAGLNADSSDVQVYAGISRRF